MTASRGPPRLAAWEFGKSAWTTYVVDRLTGFETRSIPRPPILFLGAEAESQFAEYDEQMSIADELVGTR